MVKTINKKSSFLDPEFGYEDLYSGLYSSKKKTVTKNPIDYVSKAGLLAPLKDVNAVDPISFAIEAMHNLGESETFGFYATAGLENIGQNIALIKKVKDAYGIESLDPLKFGVEAFDFKAVFGKIKDAIITAFRKLVQTVSNIVRSAGNFIASAAFKGQETLWQKYRTTIDKYVKKNGDNVSVTVMVPVGGADAIPKYIKTVGDSAKSFSAKAAEYTTLISNISTNILSAASQDGKASEMTGRIKKETIKINELMKGLVKNLTNSQNLDDGAEASYIIKLPSSSMVVKQIIFGTDKPISLKAGTALSKLGGINVLNPAQKVAVKTLIDSSNSSIKGMNTAIKDVINVSKNVEKTISSTTAAIGKGAGKVGAKQASSIADARKLYQSVGIVRQYHGWFAGVIISAYSCYIKHRSYVAQTVRALVSGKGVKEGKANGPKGMGKAIDEKAMDKKLKK
jgi:hypothetical protein